MRSLILSLVLLMAATAVYAQSPVRNRDIQGTTWEMVFELENSESESAIERITLNAVDGLLDEINIRMTFEKNGELVIHVSAFGDEEIEYSDWEIVDGQLHIGDHDQIDVESDFWMRDGRKLVPYEVNSRGDIEGSDKVYMRRVRE